jgi:DNA/RNA endonuclease YhcR with UshA esterase domain
MRRLVFVVIGAALLAGTAAYAHHSYSATYDVSNEVKLEGKLVQFVYRNPHSFVHVQAPDKTGAQQRWAVEWSGTGQLAEAGVQRDTLKVGDVVVITGRPSRVPGEFRVLMVTLQRPKDGFRWGGRGGQVVD